ncbi:MAG: hypothetical protein IKL53_08745, partial [Lachnospiraceae bacterium]|nr:hypothetical protein [Lachnospiraceae bacterium]
MGLLDKFKAYLNEEDPEDYQEVEEGLASPQSEEESVESDEDMDLSLEDDMDEESEQDGKPVKKFTWGAKLKNALAAMSKKKSKLNMDDQDVIEEVRQTKTVNAEIKAVQDFCEQLVDVSYHMEDLKREYQVVTSYLTDIQRIEELPIEMANDLIDNAKRIEM